MTIAVVPMPGKRPYPPRVSDFTATFWTGLAEGRLLTTRGAKSGQLAFPPRPFCPHTLEHEVEWIELSGRGTLYSYTTIYAAPRAFADRTPYRVCIVDLDEGLRVAAGLMGDGAPQIGDPATAVAMIYEDGPLLGFTQAATIPSPSSEGEG